MEKPITVKADELAQGIAYLANNSGLPAFIVAGILNDLYLEARKLASQQLRKDNDAWNEYQKSQGIDPPQVNNEDIE